MKYSYGILQANGSCLFMVFYVILRSTKYSCLQSMVEPAMAVYKFHSAYCTQCHSGIRSILLTIA